MNSREARVKLMSKIDPTKEVVKENLELFWDFITERQKIWYRRYIDKAPAPWTKDPILRDNKFTNIYRELDRGTVWYMENIANHKRSRGRKSTDAKIFWQTVCYRVLNRVSTFEYAGLPPFSPSAQDLKRYRVKLQKCWDETGSLVTAAHLTLPIHKKGMNKLDGYMEFLRKFDEDFSRLWYELREVRSLEKAWEYCKQIPMVGGFIAYEIVCDLVMADVFPFTLNDWANAGPGCRSGTKVIFPKLAAKKDWLSAIRYLVEHQGSALNKRKFPYWRGLPLSYRNIEHSLCEFYKYFKVMHRVGKCKLRFKPTDEKLYNTFYLKER